MHKLGYRNIFSDKQAGHRGLVCRLQTKGGFTLRNFQWTVLGYKSLTSNQMEIYGIGVKGGILEVQVAPKSRGE